MRLEILLFHFVVVFKTAAGQDHGSGRTNCDVLAVQAGDETTNFTLSIRDEFLCRCIVVDRDIPLEDIIFEDLEQPTAVLRRMCCVIAFTVFQAGNVADFAVSQSFASRKRIIAQRRGHLDRGAVQFGETAQIIRHLGHAIGKNLQNIVRCPSAAGCLEIGKGFISAI